LPKVGVPGAAKILTDPVNVSANHAQSYQKTKEPLVNFVVKSNSYQNRTQTESETGKYKENMSTNNKDLIPTGIYRGKGVSAQFVKSSKKDTDGIEIICEITAEGLFKGRRLPCNCWITDDKSGQRALESLKYCGWDGADLDALGGFGSEEVDLVVQTEDPQPKPRDPSNPAVDPGFYPQKNRVAFINQLGSGAVGREMTGEEKLGFNARMAGLVGKVFPPGTGGQNGAVTSGKKQAAAPTSPAGGKLPF
jgi:hypothetical protein